VNVTASRAFIVMLGAIAGLLLFAPPSRAQYSAAYTTCVNSAGSDAANLTVCAQTELNRQDARLNHSYRKRMTQISADPAATTALRADERKWIRARDAKCKTDSACLLKETADRADLLTTQAAAASPSQSAVATGAQLAPSAMASTDAASAIPHELIGRWTVLRTLPTKTISCWGETEAKALIGTQIIYTADSLQWKDAVAKDPKVTRNVITARNFALNNSGGGANDSNVSFKQLGITSSRATQVTIEHPDATVTGSTTEIPGDSVLLRDPTHIIFSVCNLYFLAERKP
jgi:uncharacterized protein YecT (DUF1311 family)